MTRHSWCLVGGGAIIGLMWNENHRRYLLSQLLHIDKLLGESLSNLRAGDDGRLFDTFIPDATAAQCKVLHDYVAELRFLIRRFLTAQGLEGKPELVSALWSFRVAVNFADIAVEELRPKYLRAYGELAPDPSDAVEQLAAELKTLLRRVADYLDSGGPELSERLAQLDSTADEIDLLRELERIIRAHGFVQARAPLEQLTERAIAPRFELAIFGRVNSGKSSLLNWWLGVPLLPTGVRPVTAVPIRVLRGETAEMRVTTISRSRTVLSLDELPAYVTESQNPSNSKGVVDLEIRFPSARLLEGLCLVDTPGLGSLASVGAAQTLQYLPRCDLGVLLIEAGGVMGREELDAGRALLEGGSELGVALSKSDRLPPEELSQALHYTREELHKALGVAIPVSPISTLPAGLALTEAWFERELSPRLATLREQSTRALRRKIGVLRESVIALLESRLRSYSDSVVGPGAAGLSANRAADRLSEGRLAIERERRAVDSIGWDMQQHRDLMFDSAVDALTEAWSAAPNARSVGDACVRAAIERTASAAADPFAERLEALRLELQGMIRRSGAAPDVQLPSPRGRPQIATDLLGLPQEFASPHRPHGLRPWLRMQARQRIGAEVRERIARQLQIFGKALRYWGTRYLDELACGFDAALAVGNLVARFEARPPGAADDLAVSTRQDLASLRRWAPAEPARP